MNKEQLKALMQQYKNIDKVQMQDLEINIEEYKQGKLDISPDVYLLNVSDELLREYRRSREKEYLVLSNKVRKVAHKVHWKMLKLKCARRNTRFISMV